MRAIFAVALICLMSNLSFAQGQGPGQGMGPGDGPCHGDVQKFCKDTKPGGGAIIKCLKENEANLSAECKDHQAKVKEKAKEVRAEAKDACKADVETLCKDVKPGGGAIVKCLNQNESKLSAACKEFHAKMKDKMKDRRKNRKGKSDE